MIVPPEHRGHVPADASWSSLDQPAAKVLQPPNLEGRLREEVRGDYLLYLTEHCPAPVAERLIKLETATEIEALFGSFIRIGRPSRRAIFASGLFRELSAPQPVFKQKSKKLNDPHYPGLDIENFTTNIFHEMQTALALQEIVQQRQADLLSVVELQGQRYRVEYSVQLPWGALIDPANLDRHFGIFEYLDGISVRNQAAAFQHWNQIPEPLRQLYGRIQVACNSLANVCVAEGLEPWDLGCHQVVYRLDHDQQVLHLGVVDTEEFNFTADGHYWPESFVRIGLPPVLLEAMLFSLGGADDEE